VDEVRIYEGGYRGEKGALAKSAMDLTPKEGSVVPLSILPVLAGVLIALGLWRKP